MFETLTNEELAITTGGGAMDFLGKVAPSTGINMGVNAMSLLDHPQKTLDGIRDGLGIQRSGNPGDVYTPAQMNSSGGITPGFFSPPPSDGPSVPISQ
ncbi:MAG: hypothetical protein QM831_36615 [Kofleriaceae bacterium]